MKIRCVLSGVVMFLALQLPCLGADQSQTTVEAERGPKVITNIHRAQTDMTEATQVKDASPESIESVDESRAPRTITVPVGAGPHRVNKSSQRKTLAIALGGGGARGAAHIGILRVLEQENIPLDYIVGNSMGAIVGGLYAAGVPLHRLDNEIFWKELHNSYLPGLVKRAVSLPLAKLCSPFRKSCAGIWSGEKFERFLAKQIPPAAQDMSSLIIPFSAVATNLVDGNAYRISEGKLATAIRASSTIAPLLKPVTIGDSIYIDGAMRANLPASAAKDTGADVVIAVLVDEPLRKLSPNHFRSYRGIANRLADVILAVTDEHQLQFADVIVNPDVSNIPIFATDIEVVRRAVAAGEAAARKALPIIRQKLALPKNAELVQTEIAH